MFIILTLYLYGATIIKIALWRYCEVFMLYVCFGTFVRGIIVNAILLVTAGVLFALLNLFGIPFSILGTTIFIGIIFLLILGFFVIMMWAGGDTVC